MTFPCYKRPAVKSFIIKCSKVLKYLKCERLTQFHILLDYVNCTTRPCRCSVEEQGHIFKILKYVCDLMDRMWVEDHSLFFLTWNRRAVIYNSFKTFDITLNVSCC
jgi:hypothetical protein